MSLANLLQKLAAVLLVLVVLCCLEFWIVVQTFACTETSISNLSGSFQCVFHNFIRKEINFFIKRSFFINFSKDFLTNLYKFV